MLWLDLLGLIGLLAIGATLWVLGRLSQRLGRVTRARPRFRLLYASALLIWGGALARALFFIESQRTQRPITHDNVLYTLFGDGLPAVGITLGLLVTWYYWSWLLAERD